MSAEPVLYDEQALVRFGTSSFSSKDWVGPFYPRGTQPRAFLTEYARHFDTVEVDATYYALPSARLVDGWREKVPDGFLLSAKFPKSIVHAGKTFKPDPTRIMDPDATYEDRDVFLEQMQRMGSKLAYLLIQFPYFNRATFPSEGPFLERLDTFLRDLPKEGFRYAVEIRNKAWLKPAYVDLLRHHGASLVLVDQAWMPHGDEVTPKFDVSTGQDCYMRLLGDRKQIEALKVRRAEREAKNLEDAKAQAVKIGETHFAIAVKTGESGKMFGAVTSIHVHEKLVEAGFDAIARKQVLLSDPIKEIGQHSATIKIFQEVEAELRFDVVSENPILEESAEDAEEDTPASED